MDKKKKKQKQEEEEEEQAFLDAQVRQVASSGDFLFFLHPVLLFFLVFTDLYNSNNKP